MGANTLLDIVGSIIVGGLILLILFRLNSSATSNLYNENSELTVQQAMVSQVQVIESDFRKIGYCKIWTKIPDPTKAILLADSTRIKFLTDLDNDGAVDSLYYYLVPTSELPSTPNPKDRLLYRVVNAQTAKSSNIGITNFKLTYYDALDKKITPLPVANTGQIHKIQIDLQVENSESVDSVYTTVFWRQVKLAARNLQNR